MIHIDKKEDCCGCWACENICPKHCITMVKDTEGFLYPTVDTKLCIECGLCQKVCPIKNNDKENYIHSQSGFLVQNKDEEIRKESTSGGAFTAIATWIIQQGGIVFGAAYDQGSFKVIHRYVETKEELKIFRNSKYVQSEIGNTFKEALIFLKQGRWVCFSGTPCQIEGLKKFLKNKEYDKLICVDVICRGVPSPQILEKYLNSQQKKIGGQFTNVLFRDKYYGYHYSSFSIYNKDEKRNYHKGVETNAYLRAFFHNLSDRPSCYHCQFKKRYRVSDLTLWDCFSVEKFTKQMDEKGTTCVLAHSIKGKNLMNEIKNNIRIIDVDADKLVIGVREMLYSIPQNSQRSDFFRDFNNMESIDFFDKWFPITYKVRINASIRLTCHKLGIYSLAKRLFMKFYTRRDERKVS